MTDIILKIQGQDFSNKYESGSLQKQETLNNTKNTCSFTVIQDRVFENQNVEIFETTFLTDIALSGQNQIKIYNISEFQQKYRLGDEILIGIGETYEKTYTIASIHYNTKIIQLTENLAINLPVKTKIGKKFFGGKISKVREIERTKTNNFEYSVNCVGYEEAMDREVVNETFLDKYFREIVGLIVYEFVANDTQKTFFDFETSLTPGGVGLATNDDTEDRIEGNNCQTTGTSSSGIATRTKTIPSIDFTNYTDFKFRWKASQEGANKMLSMKIRFGQDTSNYYEYDIPRIGTNFGDCWNYESFKKTGFSGIVGSPNLTNIVFFQIEIDCDGAITDGDLRFDQAIISTGGFTINNVLRGTVKFEDVRFRGKKPSVVFEQLTKLYDEYWYVDYDRDIHYYYTQGETVAPFEITETSKTYGKLDITVDSSEMVNRQQVEGSEAPGQQLYIQTRVADGEQDSRNLDYKPVGKRTINGQTFDGLRAYVNTVEVTVGVENLPGGDTKDFLYNFSEKVFKNNLYPKLNVGDILELKYYPYKTIAIRYQDQNSIDAMKLLTGGSGVYDGQIIVDKSIQSIREARQRAKIEVDSKKNAIVTAQFVTNIDGLKTGQMINIVDTDRNIDGSYQIQKITAKQKDKGGFWSYQVTATTSVFGYIEFMQLLLKRSERLLLDTQNVVIIPINDDETIKITDNYLLLKKTQPYFAGDKDVKWYDFLLHPAKTKTTTGYIGKPQDGRYAIFTGETGSASYNKITNHNSGSSLKIVSQVGGNGKSIEVQTNYKRPLKSNIQYSFDATAQVGELTNLGTSATFNIQLLEFQNENDVVPLEIHTLFDYTTKQDFFNDGIIFTSNINTNFYQIIINLEECIGNVEITDIRIIDSSLDTTSNPGIIGFSSVS